MAYVPGTSLQGTLAEIPTVEPQENLAIIRTLIGTKGQ